MATCSICNTAYGDGVPFCPKCGSLPGKPARRSYVGSVLLGVALLALAVLWKFVASQAVLIEKPATVVPPPPDDAATLVTKCGLPDSDTLAEVSGLPQNPTRSLVYRKARVKAVFHHVGSSRDGWQLQGMLDAKTSKPIGPDKVTKRLPCAGASLNPPSPR